MAEQLADQWSQCKQAILHRLGEEDAATWLPPLELIYLDPEKAVLGGIPNTFVKTRIQEHFSALLQECLTQAFSNLSFQEHFRLELKIGKSPRALQEIKKNLPGNAASPDGTKNRSQPGGRKTESEEEHHRFENFMEGTGNRLALQFARQVAEEPGKRYNPFFLVGASGSGKTHLLRAIAHQVSQFHPAWKVIYLTAESYTNEVLDGIRLKRMKILREKFRTADILLLDDVDFLRVSTKTQLELLHTFDALNTKGKQTVFSADRFPGIISDLDPTLRARMEMGLIAELDPADFDLRLKIITAKAQADQVPLPESSARFLAERITGGPRQLEGALVRLAAYSSLQEEPISQEFVERVAAPFFDRQIKPPGLPLTSNRIISSVCDQFGLTMKTLRSRERTSQVSQARRVAVFLLREAGGLSYPEIGALLGNRDHSTIIQAFQTFQQELKKDEKFKQAVLKLQDGLYEKN